VAPRYGRNAESPQRPIIPKRLYLGQSFETIDPPLLPPPLHQSPSHSRCETVQASKPRQLPREHVLLNHTYKNLIASPLLPSTYPPVRIIILRSRTRLLLRGDRSAHDLRLMTLMRPPRALDIDPTVALSFGHPCILLPVYSNVLVPIVMPICPPIIFILLGPLESRGFGEGDCCALFKIMGFDRRVDYLLLPAQLSYRDPIAFWR
jgi:hypothetical protein